MSIVNRLLQLEKRKHKKGNEKINIVIVGDDPNDPIHYLIIDPYGKEPRRVSRKEHEAENKRLEEAGETVILIGYKDIVETYNADRMTP